MNVGTLFGKLYGFLSPGQNDVVVRLDLEGFDFIVTNKFLTTVIRFRVAFN